GLPELRRAGEPSDRPARTRRIARRPRRGTRRRAHPRAGSGHLLPAGPRLPPPKPPPTEIMVPATGAEHSLEVEPRLLLVPLLREKLGLTGTHVGCDTTSCGAWKVLVDGGAVKSG